ncbi:unnamed protein product [Oikopleura dioica]|uniref:Ribosomal protein S2 n=1 Tax=Oikopleura dioica TaxID=34765 RepID=E4X9C5_OIKDI|nr:unnamed protein product [Oikopleura dioica]
MWRVGLRNQSSAVQLQASSSVMKNRAKDNIVFQKLLEQKDCFDLKNKIKWQDMYKARMHLGHSVIMRNPFMEPYILGCRNGTDIIDLDQSRAQLLIALNFIGHVALRGGTILFMPNSEGSSSRAALKAAKEAGEYCDTSVNEPVFVSDNATRVEPDIVILLNCLGKTPGVLPRHITGCCERNIPIIGIVDTDINPSMISYPIPCNDESTLSVNYVLKQMVDVILNAKELRNSIQGYGSHMAQSNIEKNFQNVVPSSYDMSS